MQALEKYNIWWYDTDLCSLFDHDCIFLRLSGEILQLILIFKVNSWHKLKYRTDQKLTALSFGT